MKRIILYSMLLLTTVKTSSQTISNNTDAEQNKKLVTVMNDLFNKNQQEAAIKYFSDSLVNLGNISGKSFFRAINDDIRLTFPDVQTNITRLWAEGDWVIADCIFSGTHKGIATLPHHGGMLVGKPATGKSFKVQHIRMYKIRNGKITERKAVRDDIGMYQQLGLLPAAPVFR